MAVDGPADAAKRRVSLTILAGTDRSQTGLAQDRAVITGAPYGPGACRSASTCVNDLNTSSFALPAIGSFGNVGKGLLVGPNLIDLDAGFVKSIPVRERFQVQLRVEFFNILNRANFNNPNNSVSGAGFGTILSAGDPRIGQLALKVTLLRVRSIMSHSRYASSFESP